MNTIEIISLVIGVVWIYWSIFYLPRLLNTLFDKGVPKDKIIEEYESWPK